MSVEHPEGRLDLEEVPVGHDDLGGEEPGHDRMRDAAAAILALSLSRPAPDPVLQGPQVLRRASDELRSRLVRSSGRRRGGSPSASLASILSAWCGC